MNILYNVSWERYKEIKESISSFINNDNIIISSPNEFKHFFYLMLEVGYNFKDAVKEASFKIGLRQVQNILKDKFKVNPAEISKCFTMNSLVECPERIFQRGFPRRRIINKEVSSTLLENGKCSHCGNEEYLCIDHKVPISKNGTDEVFNLQVMCRSCNSTKSNTLKPEVLRNFNYMAQWKKN